MSGPPSRVPKLVPKFTPNRPFAGCRNLFDQPVGEQQHRMQRHESPELNMNSNTRDSRRLQARRCGAPAGPSDLATGLIRLSLACRRAARHTLLPVRLERRPLFIFDNKRLARDPLHARARDARQHAHAAASGEGHDHAHRFARGGLFQLHSGAKSSERIHGTRERFVIHCPSATGVAPHGEPAILLLPARRNKAINPGPSSRPDPYSI